MGDTGSLLLGYVLATMSVLGLFKFYAVVSFAVPLLAIAVPLFDTTFAFCRRILKGQSPMHPDRGHFHHRLIDMGLSQKQAVAVLYSISAILGLAAVVITTSGEIKALILILGFCLCALLWAFVYGKLHQNGIFSRKDKHNDRPDAEENKVEPNTPEETKPPESSENGDKNDENH